MLAPIARIIARYISGALISYGVMAAPDVAVIESDLALIVGLALGTISEAAYALAVKKGWAK